MIKIATAVNQITGLANFNVYDDVILVLAYTYDNATQITNITALANDLTMPFTDYVKNVGILKGWVDAVQSNFALTASINLTTARNYDYDYPNNFRRLSANIDSNLFKVRYNYNTKNIIVKARNAFAFNFSQLSYFTNCHINFFEKNDLF